MTESAKKRPPRPAHRETTAAKPSPLTANITSLGRIKPVRAAGQRAVDLARRTPHLRPDTVLGREWNGQVHRVALLADGFAWNGKTYPSLSKVAHAITGTRWNGPKFFGLRDKPSKGPHHDEDISKPVHCAIYTRVSTDLGLEQVARCPIRFFTSLYPQPSAHRMEPAANQIRRRGLLGRQAA
jgi:DUF2924 family protein